MFTADAVLISLRRTDHVNYIIALYCTVHHIQASLVLKLFYTIGICVYYGILLRVTLYTNCIVNFCEEGKNYGNYGQIPFANYDWIG